MKKMVSGIILTLLLISMLTLAFKIQPVKASGTIYIMADGSIEGTASIQTADNVTYVFTANINDHIVIERNNIIIDGNEYTLEGPSSENGIDLSGRTNVTVKKVQIKKFNYGIELSSSSNNTISGNNITGNMGTVSGIHLSSSNYNTISRNYIKGGFYCIYLKSSSNCNVISENNITAIACGIYVDSSSGNIISGNNITDNTCGIMFTSSSSGNMIYHNSFINNVEQAYSYILNTWDDGYPSGGNYWSDYVGGDLYHGPYQNITGSDEIGDTAYTIDIDNQDRYPLMKPYVLGDLTEMAKLTRMTCGISLLHS